jgi:O-antigen/teichoic acid export membrane protein
MREAFMRGNATEEQSATVFDLPHQDDVPRLARRGLNWMALLMAGRYVLSAGTSVILTRFISPYEYGLMGMVATLTVLVQAFSDFGLSWATMQHDDLSREQIDMLWAVNVGLGLLLMALCMMVSPALARFYGHPELTKLSIACSVALFLSSVAAQPTALMRRQMHLGQVAVSGLIALVFSSVVSLAMAWHGYGYWALVAQMVVSQVVTVALVFPMSGYWPRLPRRLAPVGAMLAFGGFSMAFGMVTYISRNLDNVLIGKYWGAVALGYYTRAYFLMQFPGYLAAGIFSNVVVSAMSSMRRSKNGMEETYILWLRRIALTTCPIAAGMAAASGEAVGVLYGHNWMPVVPILLWLSIASILQPISNTASWIYIAARGGGGMLNMGIIIAITSVASFVIGLPQGPIGVARAYAIMNTLIAYPILAMAHRQYGMGIGRSLRGCMPIVASAVAMGAVVRLASYAGTAMGIEIHLRLLAEIVIGVVVYGGFLRVASRSSYDEVTSYRPWQHAAAQEKKMIDQDHRPSHTGGANIAVSSQGAL